MSLTAGSWLGPYQVLASIGSGGMGEVYRARDSRLERDVAIKVLPQTFAADPDRRARFEREAKAIAALSHPNILSVFDTGEHAGQLFVVTELLEGETLRRRLASGSIPVRKSIEFAVQIARGLAAAHERGIVHRDLKPDNVFVSADGHLKILDFGLARQVSSGTGATETSAGLTDPGTVMGTVGYMAPEQVRGQAVDGRADLFALGAILYEMLSGRRAFVGQSAADTIAAVVKEEPPDLVAARADVPPLIERVVRHCLEKNPAARFQTARDVGFALESISSASSSASITANPPRVHWRARVIPWALAAITLAIAVASVWPRETPAIGSDAHPIVTMIPMPTWLWPELSPDGRYVASVGIVDGRPLVRVRALDSVDLRTLPGTDNVSGFFWWPDSKHIGVLSIAGRLERFALSGDTPQLLREGLGGNFTGAAANENGTLLFTNGLAKGPLLKLAPGTTEPAPATALDQARGETAHVWPVFLPDGRRFLYTALATTAADATVFLGSLDSPARTLVLSATSRVQIAPGYLLFLKGTALMAQPFDSETARLSGVAKPLTASVDSFPGCACAGFTASTNGLVGYSDQGTLAIRNSQLKWFNRQGALVGRFGEAADYVAINLSRDDIRIAISLMDPATHDADIWIGDLARNQPQPLVTSAGSDYDPQWSDGRIVYSSSVEGAAAVFSKSTVSNSDGSRLVPLVPQTEAIFVSDVSAGDNYVIAQSADGRQVFYAPLKPTPGKLVAYGLNPTSSKDQLHFSPDEKWVVYDDTLPGRYEIYVTAFPTAGEPIPVSVGGGVQPRWTKKGAEIVYLSLDGSMMAVSVTHPTPNTIQIGKPERLFHTPLTDPSPGWEQFDVTKDGQRFIIITPPAGRVVGLNLLLNWQSKLK